MLWYIASCCKFTAARLLSESSTKKSRLDKKKTKKKTALSVSHKELWQCQSLWKSPNVFKLDREIYTDAVKDRCALFKVCINPCNKRQILYLSVCEYWICRKFFLISFAATILQKCGEPTNQSHPHPQNSMAMIANKDWWYRLWQRSLTKPSRRSLHVVLHLLVGKTVDNYLWK